MRKFPLIIAMLSCFVGCKKESDESKDPFYFKGTVNGQSVVWTAPFVGMSQNNNRFVTAISTPGGSMPLPCQLGTSGLDYQDNAGINIFERHESSNDFRNYISVRFSRTRVNGGVDNMIQLFTNGVKTYGLLRINCTDRIIDGITISYTDSNGKEWESSWGDQSSNTFEQISLEDETRTQEFLKKWKARFSCKLYDAMGNSIHFSNCEIYGPVIPV